MFCKDKTENEGGYLLYVNENLPGRSLVLKDLKEIVK